MPEKRSLLTALLAAALLVPAGFALAAGSGQSPVIEESFYTVSPENREEFLRVYRTRLYPFWEEMRKRGITTDRYRMYSQRIHSLKPLWTYKTVVKFKNYAAIDRWLEIKDEVYRKMFPGESGYGEPRKIVDSISGNHWDEFLREIPLDR